MMALALPMMVFYALAVVIGFLIQKARRKKAVDPATVS